MHRFLAEVALLVIIVTSCAHEKNRVEKAHLHNFPYLDDCPSIEARSIDNEAELKAQAKALNMRYVDYLHFLSEKQTKSNKSLTTNE